jgi:hypothetical protein
MYRLAGDPACKPPENTPAKARREMRSAVAEMLPAALAAVLPAAMQAAFPGAGQAALAHAPGRGHETGVGLAIMRLQCLQG